MFRKGKQGKEGGREDIDERGKRESKRISKVRKTGKLERKN